VRVHWLQHADEDDLGCIAPWLAARGHAVTRSALHLGEALPSPEDFDALLVMGGAMHVDQHAEHPWLVEEKRFLREVLASDRGMLGICLGAQLVAEVAGASVARNREPEIGWFDLQLTAEAARFDALAGWPARVQVFHWHEYAFDLPPGATRLACSEACDQQAYALDGGRVIGLQFHPEVTSANLRAWLQEPVTAAGAHVQPAAEMRFDLSRFARANTLLLDLMERWLPS
jgi:GMP synthase-like glutamine amidotransferase